MRAAEEAAAAAHRGKPAVHALPADKVTVRVVSTHSGTGRRVARFRIRVSPFGWMAARERTTGQVGVARWSTTCTAQVVDFRAFAKLFRAQVLATTSERTRCVRAAPLAMCRTHRRLGPACWHGPARLLRTAALRVRSPLLSASWNNRPTRLHT